MQLRTALRTVLVALAIAATAAKAYADETPPGSAEEPTAPDASSSEAAAPAEVDGGAEPPRAPDASPEPSSPSAAEASNEARKAESNITARASADVSGYIDTVATTVLTPSVAGTVENVTAGWAVTGRYLVDVVSAASPDIVSTASPPFKEVRQGGNLGFRYKPGTFGVAGGAVVSYSPDYLSLGGGFELSQDLDDKNITLTQGYHYGHDVIGRAGTSFSVFSRELDYHTLTLGVSRVVNAGLVLGLTGDAILERGDQSKPYRYIPIFSPAVASTVPRGASVDSVVASRLQARPLEQLPLERDRFAVTGRLAWRTGGTTLRIDQRGYGDSWSQYASTTDARYFIDLSERLIFWPHVRFHVQNGASFWKRAYSATGINDLPAIRTGDRELSPLYNVGLGAGLRFALGKAGKVDDVAWTTTFDTTYTSFADAIYVTDRLSALLTTGLELTF